MGACKVLGDHIRGLDTFGTYVGCSIGSVLAVLFACGYTPTEIFSEGLATNIEGLLQVGNVEDMIRHMGFFDQAPIREYMKTLIEKKVDIPDLGFQKFYEVTGKDLYIVAVNPEQTEKIVFGRSTTPEVPVLEGIIASCSIPFVIQGTDFGSAIVVDGAVMDPLGLDVAVKISPAGGNLYVMFFCGPRLADKFLSLRISERGVRENILTYWGRTDILSPSVKRDSSTLEKLLFRGRSVYKCMSEALLENYLFRIILENQFGTERPRNIHLLPLPIFDITLFSSPEMKVHMYYTGVDVLSTMVKEKYLA